MLKVLLHQVSEKCNLIKFIIFVHVAQQKKLYENTTTQAKQSRSSFSISLLELTSSIVITERKIKLN